MKRLVLAIVLLMAIPAMLAGCAKSESDSIRDSINGFASAYNAGDYDKCADNLIGISEADKSTIAQHLRELKALVPSIEVTHIEEIKVDGSTATAKVTAAAMGQTQTNVINLTKVDGKWEFAGGDVVPQTGG